MKLGLSTKSGLLTLSAESYSLDFSRGILAARNVRLFEPAGPKVGSAESLFIQLPWPGRDGVVHVRASGSDILVERDESGEFRFLRFLPETTKEPSQTPYSIELENTSVTLLDHTGNQTWSRKWSAPSLTIEGVGDVYDASGQIRQAAVGGTISGTLRQGPEEFSATLNSDEFDLAPYIERFKLGPEAKSFPEVARLRVSELIFNGKIGIDASPKKPPVISGLGLVRATNLQYREYTFSSAGFEGTWTGTGAIGKWQASEPAGSGEAQGYVDWKEKLRIEGNANINVKRYSALPQWIRKLAPKELDLQYGKFQGTIAFTPESGFGLSGSIEADNASWLDESLSDAGARVQVSGNSFFAQLDRGKWRGNAVSGALSRETKTDALKGFLISRDVDLSKFRSVSGIDQLAGRSDFAAEIAGTGSKPVVTMRAKGSAKFVLNGHTISVDDYQSIGTLKGTNLRIQQLGAQVGGGRLTASGFVDLKTKKINGRAFIGGASLSAFDDQLLGSGAAEATIDGTISNPRARGSVELYGVNFHGNDFPFLASDIFATRHLVEAQNIRGARASARIFGEAKWDVDTDALSGRLNAEGIELSDLFGELFAGVASIPEFKIGGTTSHPSGTFTINAEDLVAFGAKVDSGRATGKLDGSQLILDSAVFSADEGKITATGSYDLNAESGSISATAEKLDLHKFLPELPDQTVIGGTANGSLQASFEKRALVLLQAKGTADSLTVNPTLLGAGSWEAAYADGIWSGSAQIGQIERYLEATGIRFDPAKNLVSGTFTAYGMPIKDIYLALRPSFTSGGTQKAPPPFELPPALVEKFDNLQGFLDASVSVSGDPNDPEVSIETATARDLTIYGVKSGELEVKALRKGAVWNVDRFLWTNGPARMDVTGTIAEHGDIALDGNVDNVATSWLETLLPGAANLEGEIRKLSFLVSGPTSDPTVQASALATLFDKRKTANVEPNAALPAKQAEPERDTRLVVNLDDIVLSNSGAKVAGSFSYLGFKGGLKGSLPYRFPLTPDENQPVSLTIDLLNRPIKDLYDLIPSLDQSRTEGEIGGRISVGGTLKDLKVDGLVTTKGASVAMKGSRTSFEKLDLTAQIVNDSFQVLAHADGSQGGSFDTAIHLAFKDLVSDFRNLFQYAAGLVPAPPELPVSGNIDANALRILEELRFVPDPKSRPGRIDAIATGKIDIGGTLREPKLTSKDAILISNATLRLPDEVLPSEGGYFGTIKPQFSLDFAFGSAENPATISLANGNFVVTGDGHIGGTLSDPRISSNFDVKSGAVRLPNARIQIEEGGSARFTYSVDTGGFSTPRLDIDLDGKTGLTATAINGIVERYDVNLHLTGNLMSEGDLKITAQSDPPGLSEDRILALLGQGGVFETVGPQGPGSQFQHQLQSAITGVAVPYLLDPFTQRIAREIGLEYLSLEYNAYEGATVTLGKTLSKGLAIQYRRQISETIDGRQHFDIRLTYRPIRKGKWNNLYFSIGADETRPWKISLEYGIRF